MSYRFKHFREGSGADLTFLRVMALSGAVLCVAVAAAATAYRPFSTALMRIALGLDDAAPFTVSYAPAERTQTALLDLNRAEYSDLLELPGIGSATAGAIIEYREMIGYFRSVDDLLNVEGIGEAKLDAIREFVCVD